MLDSQCSKPAITGWFLHHYHHLEALAGGASGVLEQLGATGADRSLLQAKLLQPAG